MDHQSHIYSPLFQNYWKNSLLLVCSAILSTLILAGALFAAVPGEPAPAFSLTSFSGEKLTLAQLKGKVVYLDFWATWCPPCKKSLPWMNELNAKYQSQGLKIIAINQDSNLDTAKEALAQISATFISASDPNGEIASAYKLRAMPSSFLIDQDGIVRGAFAGFHDDEAKTIESQIQELLPKAAHR